MRLPLLSPASLSPEQQKLSEDMRQGIESNFKGFQAINSEGALIGPWNPWLRFSKFGGPIWELDDSGPDASLQHLDATFSGARTKAIRRPGRGECGSTANSAPRAFSSAQTASMFVTASPMCSSPRWGG